MPEYATWMDVEENGVLGRLESYAAGSFFFGAEVRLGLLSG
jgi:hypothetical protein